MNVLLLVAAGGALGAVARYCVTMLVGVGKLGQIATFPVNVAGCFAAGVLTALVVDAPSGWRLFFGTGFLGGFTTYSAFSLEVAVLLSLSPIKALAYAVTVTAVCAGVALLGLWFGRLVTL